MKILLVNKYYYPVIGGIERIVQWLAEGLHGRSPNGADIRVLTCRRKGATTQGSINGVPVLKASSAGALLSMPLSLSFFYWFNRMKKDRDILHMHMPFPLGDLALCLFGFKGKVVLGWHSDIVRQKRFLFFYKPFLRRTLKRADLIIVGTQGHIDDSEHLPAYRDKCVVIPYGVIPDGGSMGISSASSTNTPSNAPVAFLFVGRLVGYKGCDVLLEALARTTGTKLDIIGEGPLEKRLKEHSRRLGIEERVRFWGGVSDDVLARAMAACDVFVLPSVQKSEAFGLVQAEAMAYGKPVINTRLPGGVPYVSLDGVTGLTVPPADAAALAQAMQKLADDPVLRAAYGEAAGRRASAEYTRSVMLDRVAEQYAQLMRRSHPNGRLGGEDG